MIEKCYTCKFFVVDPPIPGHWVQKNGKCYLARQAPRHTDSYMTCEHHKPLPAKTIQARIKRIYERINRHVKTKGI